MKEMVKIDNKICKWVVQDALFTTGKIEQFKSSIVSNRILMVVLPIGSVGPGSSISPAVA